MTRGLVFILVGLAVPAVVSPLAGLLKGDSPWNYTPVAVNNFVLGGGMLLSAWGAVLLARLGPARLALGGSAALATATAAAIVLAGVYLLGEPPIEQASVERLIHVYGMLRMAWVFMQCLALATVLGWSAAQAGVAACGLVLLLGVTGAGLPQVMVLAASAGLAVGFYVLPVVLLLRAFSAEPRPPTAWDDAVVRRLAGVVQLHLLALGGLQGLVLLWSFVPDSYTPTRHLGEVLQAGLLAAAAWFTARLCRRSQPGGEILRFGAAALALSAAATAAGIVGLSGAVDLASITCWADLLAFAAAARPTPEADPALAAWVLWMLRIAAVGLGLQLLGLVGETPTRTLVTSISIALLPVVLVMQAALLRRGQSAPYANLAVFD